MRNLVLIFIISVYLQSFLTKFYNIPNFLTYKTLYYQSKDIEYEKLKHHFDNYTLGSNIRK